MIVRDLCTMADRWAKDATMRIVPGANNRWLLSEFWELAERHIQPFIEALLKSKKISQAQHDKCWEFVCDKAFAIESDITEGERS